MTRLLRPLLAAALVFGLAGGAHSAPPSPPAWPQAASDVRPDPAIRFGVLPNGLRYAVMKNATPPGQASLRLWIGAGSLMEEDDQQGLAHFLEHMAFNGSKNVAEGDMVKILERRGLAFGADTNASTGMDQTVYKLDLPTADEGSLNDSLMLLREAAGNLTLDPAAMDRERGVVLSEERARDTPAYRVFKAREAFLLAGQRPPTRMPIGTVEVIKGAPRERLADFYQRYYRPERAVLVAVGDFDPAEVEAKIKARFGDWTGAGPAGGDPDLGMVAARDSVVKLVVEPGATPSVQIVWARAPDLSPDTEAHRRQDLYEQLALSVLNRRLGALARGANPPFIAAASMSDDEVRAADLTSIIATFQPQGWKVAMTAAEQEGRRLVQFGVRQDELDREISEFRAALTAAAKGVATRRTPNLANTIVSTLPDHEVVTSPVQDLASFEAAVKALKAQTVDSAAKRLFQGSGPLVFVAMPTAPEGGEAAVAAAFEASRKSAVTAPAAAGVSTWPYASFGPHGRVVETRKIDDLGTTFVRFANGVRLTVKPTDFRDDEVLVQVRIGDGLKALPADRQSLGWAGSALIEGGLGKIDAEDMERVLADKIYGARFAADDDALVLSGRTRTADTPTQMQVLAAFTADPAYRPEAFDRMRAYGSTLNDQYEATDSGVLSRDLAGLLHSGDRRWTFPTREEVAATDAAAFKAQFADALAKGRIEVVIVGDVTVDAAIKSTAETFGALPARPDSAPADSRVRFPAAVQAAVERTHKGRADQAIGVIAWPTQDFYADPKRARGLTVLGEVLELRLIDELREKQGATYSPRVNYEASEEWKDYGFILASMETPPQNLPGFFADTARIAQSLRDAPITTDELERARKPRLEAVEKARHTNEYWLARLAGAQTDPRKLEAIRSIRADLAGVTIADVQRLAREVFDPAKAWKLEVKPQPGAPK